MTHPGIPRKTVIGACHRGDLTSTACLSGGAPRSSIRTTDWTPESPASSNLTGQIELHNGYNKETDSAKLPADRSALLLPIDHGQNVGGAQM